MHPTRDLIRAALLLFVSVTAASSQDTRTVVEPTFPTSCTILSAQLTISAGEPSSETAFDTSRIQTALNACAAGSAVELQPSGANSAFLIQPLTIPSGVTLLVDGGVTVFASRNPADYQISGKETCGTVGASGNGCSPILNINGNATSTGSGIMGYGVIDGRGEDKLLLNGVASTSSWWDISSQAQTLGGSQNNPILLAASHASSFTLYKITLKNSPMFHVKWQSATGFTAWGAKVITPYTARNSDGIDPSGSNITITHASISDGDDDIALSASSATSNITISNNNTYSGHGISVGSFTQGGLSNMLVSNINQAGTASDSNGIALRIKSALDRGGLVQNVTYNNICMQNHKTLIDIDPFYNANAGTMVPQFSNITFQNIHGLTAGTLTLEGRDVNHPTTLTLNNFVFDTLGQSNIAPSFQFDTITLGPGPVAPAILQSQIGTGVSYLGNVSTPSVAPYPCSAANFTFLVGELYLSTASTTNQQTLANVPGPGTVTLNAMLQPTLSQVTYGAYTGAAAPTTTVQFFEGTTKVGSAPLTSNGTLAALTLTGIPTGTHTYTAYYPGDANYSAYSFGSVSVTVVPTAAPSSTALMAMPPTTQAGSTMLLTATVTGTSLAAGPTGTITFFDGTSQIGTATVSSSTTAATASISVTLNGPGTHSLSAIYVGDLNNATSTSAAITATATAIPTTTFVGLSSNSVAVGGTATITAFVGSSAGVPQGSVTFYNGTTSLSTAALANGSASTTTTSSAVATNSISAVYSASGNYAASTSATVPLAFVTPIGLSVANFVVTVAPGQSATVVVTATPAPGFAGSVSFACSSPVAYVTCSMTPPTQTVSNGTAVQSTAMLSVASTIAALSPASFRGSKSRLPPSLALIPLAGLFLIGSRRRFPRGFVLLLVLTAGILGVSGCSTSVPVKMSPSGSQTVTITATEGAQVQTASIVVSITR
ncbi:MAG: glycosyl hydrolase family 28 protein [Acidobacteriota bacterium]|nr:glycosyl hydrolase family 28 protein [Acidobacteriota bacterium]